VLPETITANRPTTVAVRVFRVAIAELVKRRQLGDINDAQFAGLYFLYWQIALHGRAFASRWSKRGDRLEAAACLAAVKSVTGAALSDRLLGFFEGFQFRGVRPKIPAALRGWLTGRWALDLRDDVPSPWEVLRAQARGRRMVTAITRFPRMVESVLGKSNAFAFFLHDLEHAHKYFDSPGLFRSQLALFQALQAAVVGRVFEPYTADPLFAPKFHYLISDMNTHPQHAYQYLRAILIEHHLRRSGQAPTASLDPSTRQAIEGIMRAVTTPEALSAAG
jgi:hypothetical protein